MIIPPAQWAYPETAAWWHAGRAARQHIYGAATARMLDVAAIHDSSRVLDVAAGTGESTILAMDRVGPTGHVLAVDIATRMLQMAPPQVDTCVMDAAHLALCADVFDAVICRLALMLFPQPAAALAEMRRVVQPGGKVAVMVYADIARNPYHHLFYDVVQRVGGIPPPRPGQPWMYAVGTSALRTAVCHRAGFGVVSTHAVPIPRRFPSVAAATDTLRNSAGDLREVMSRVHESDREHVWMEMTEQLRSFAGPHGVEVPGEVLVGVGTKSS